MEEREEASLRQRLYVDCIIVYEGGAIAIDSGGLIFEADGCERG